MTAPKKTSPKKESLISRSVGRPSKNTEGMNPDDKGVCERIRFILEDQNITQKDAAELMQTKQTAISRIINFRNAPSLMMLKRFIKAFNVNPSYILFDDKTKGYYQNEVIDSQYELIEKSRVVHHIEVLKSQLEDMLSEVEKRSE